MSSNQQSLKDNNLVNYFDKANNLSNFNLDKEENNFKQINYTSSDLDDNLQEKLENSSLNENELGQKLYDEIKNGKWTCDEDEKLKKLVEFYGTKNWKKISEEISNRSPIQCLHRWTKILQPGLVKGPWTIEEDYELSKWVKLNGPKKWSHCAELIKGRSGKQCRERWFNTLNPNVIKGNWSTEEDYLIFKLFSEYGSKWSKISSFFKGRTENSIKNRFYSTLRRINSENKKFDSDNYNNSSNTLEDLLKYFPQAFEEKRRAYYDENKGEINFPPPSSEVFPNKNEKDFLNYLDNKDKIIEKVEKNFEKSENYFETDQKVESNSKNINFLTKKTSREKNLNYITTSSENNKSCNTESITFSPPINKKLLEQTKFSIDELEYKIYESQNLEELCKNVCENDKFLNKSSLMSLNIKNLSKSSEYKINNNTNKIQKINQLQTPSQLSPSNFLKLLKQLNQLENILIHTKNEIKKFDNMKSIFNFNNYNQTFKKFIDKEKDSLNSSLMNFNINQPDANYFKY